MASCEGLEPENHILAMNLRKLGNLIQIQKIFEDSRRHRINTMPASKRPLFGATNNLLGFNQAINNFEASPRSGGMEISSLQKRLDNKRICEKKLNPYDIKATNLSLRFNPSKFA